MISAEEIALLDPGIRDVVVRLNNAGYVTTDSGDGVSKSDDAFASGCALPFPHVMGTLPPPRTIRALQNVARDIAEVCGPNWVCEVSCSTEDPVPFWVFVARPKAVPTEDLLAPSSD